MHITGTVITGKGEGHAYLSMPGYRRQFQRHLGIQPFPGTLNLELHGENSERFTSLREQNGIHISGFEADSRTFGSVTCFPCRVNDAIDGVVVIPKKSVYEDVMEIIAEVNLRDALDLHDGDQVTVYIPLDG